MIDLDNQTSLAISLDKLENIREALSSKEVELIITDDKTMQSLNYEHRGKAQSTDVLSFPLAFPLETAFTDSSHFAMPLGSIIISASFVKDKAELLSHTQQDELALLFIHGMLHLLGFDHEVDNGEMRQKEKELIEMFDLPKSLIVRTEEY